jgi:hypothetical protein
MVGSYGSHAFFPGADSLAMQRRMGLKGPVQILGAEEEGSLSREATGSEGLSGADTQPFV